MSNINPFKPDQNDQESGESNVFINLNKPDEATGIPSVAPGAGTGFTPGAAEPSKFNGQVILAGLVFTIGVGSIYAMRYIGMQAGIKESVSMVDYTAATTNPDFIKRFETVMGDLQEVSMSVQFPESVKLPKTPFTLASTADPVDNYVAPVNNADDPSARAARLAREQAAKKHLEQEARESEITSMAFGLTLQSVIGGTRPVARISGQPVGVGMTVADTFKVLSIKGSTVVLEAEGMKFQLVLGGEAERIN